MANGLNVHRFGELAETVKGRKPHRFVDYSEKSEPYLTADVLRGESLEPKFVPHGDDSGQNVVVGPTESIILWDGAGAGDVFPGRRGILASTMAKVVIKNSSTLLDRYLFLCLQHLESEIKSACRGTTVPHVSPEALNALPIPLPEIREQKRIVDLMSSVDAYIAALEQQADTARTARNAVLHELLSAGGDDWRRVLLGDILTLEYGKPLKEENRDGKGFPVFGSAGEVGLHSRPSVSDAPVIVVGRKGTAGAVWWSDLPCSVIDTAFYVVKKSNVDTRFLYHLIESVQLPSLTAQTGVPGLNRDRAYSCEVALPPLAEQGRIVDVVSSMDEVIESTEHAVANATTLRSGLLSDLLSGDHEIPESYDRLLGAA